MSTQHPDPTPPKAGGLWARLFGIPAVPKAVADEEVPAPAPPSPPPEIETIPEVLPAPQPEPLEAAITEMVPKELLAELMLPEPDVDPSEATLPDPPVPLEPCPACGAV